MPKPTTVIHDIHIAHGDEGRRLAPTQAQAILDVLTWVAEQQRHATAQPSAGTADERPRERPTKR